MTRRIKKIAIIGSGIMGSGIACHFANIGVEVLLLDIVPRELTAQEKAKGLKLEDKVVRNRLVNDALTTSLKSKPSPIYHQKFANRITTGNLEDDIAKVADVDWIMEVVVERLDIKKIVFEKLEKYRTPGTIISSNTSGIPIQFMNEGRSEDFKKHFAVTHFFNPPRYLKLFEVVPGPDCAQEVTDFLMMYGEKFLGKTSVLAKDTPAFIGNRIGIFGIQSLFHQVKELGLTVEEVDKLTGPVIGRPKSATFRTVDVVGLDTLVHVANGIYENCPDDEAHELFKLPGFINTMMDNKWLGSKTGQGFYKKSVDANGKKEILTLDLDTLEYRPAKKAKFATLELTKTIDKGFLRIGGTAVFTLILKNEGPLTATGVQVRDLLPSGLTYDLGNSTIPASTTYNSVKGIWDLSALSITSGQSITIQIAATVNSTGIKLNTAEIISSDQSDTDSTTNNSN